jgi:hypothetical protein
LVLAAVGIGIWIGIYQLHYVEFTAFQDLLAGTMQRKRILANNQNVQRVTESLRSCKDFQTLCSTLEGSLRPIGFDGFRFRNSLANNLPEPLLAPLLITPGGGYRCSWTESETSDPAWEIQLQLLTSTGCDWGQFSLFSSHPGKLLFVDLNLLNSEFRTNLFDALQCAMNHAQLAASGREVDDFGNAASAASA